MADAGRPLQLSDSARNGLSLQSPEEAARILAERQQWARQMRLLFSPRDMIFDDGSLNPDYFKPKQQKVMVRKWSTAERTKLIKGIEKHGIGNWTQIRDEFLPTWEIGEIRTKTQRLMGRQSLAEYIEVQWKGDETMVEMEYARNKRIGLSLNHWKGGTLINDDAGVVKQRLESEPLDPEYAAYIAQRAITPVPKEPAPIDPVGQRVSVWFADVKQYFSGLVVRRCEQQDRYMLRWDSNVHDPKAQDDEVQLLQTDKTLSTTNNERWCFEGELHAHTRRPMKAHFGNAVDLQGQLPLSSPLSLTPNPPPPKKARKRARKVTTKDKFYDSDSEEYY